MMAFQFAAWIICLVAAIPLIVVGLQCFLALLPANEPRRGERSCVGVLVPAHNESAGLRRTLESVQRQLIEGDRLLVVADNCTDDTAQVARGCAAEVIERFDESACGKGYALDAGVQHLAMNPPDVVIVMDADCRLDDGCVDGLVRTVTGTGRPSQALYLMALPSRPGPESTISSFAFLIKNWVRPRAMKRLGLPVLLTGTGMAFPWSIIRNANLASGEIVEDLALGIELSLTGDGPVFCESSVVWSELPSDPEASIQQRTRWEHGYLASILRDCPRLFWKSVTSWRPALLLIAMDLAVPPLALLAIVSLLAWFIVATIGLFSNGAWSALMFLTLSGVWAGLGILAAYVVFARAVIPIRSFVAIPSYIWRKLPLYRRFVTRRQKAWVRTERDS